MDHQIVGNGFTITSEPIKNGKLETTRQPGVTVARAKRLPQRASIKYWFLQNGLWARGHVAGRWDEKIRVLGSPECCKPTGGKRKICFLGHVNQTQAGN